MVETANIIAEHGLFSRTRQVAPMCTHLIHGSWAHVSLPLNGISIGSAIFARLTHEIYAQTH